MGSSNYWADVVEGDPVNDTSQVGVFFKSRAEELGQATGGKVTAVFKPASELDSNDELYQSLLIAGQAVSSCVANLKVQPALKDANELYDEEVYAFEIQSKSYRFRVLKFRYKALFPLELIIDEGVYSELDDGVKKNSSGEDGHHSILVENSQKLEEAFRAILKTGKVRYLVNRLIQLSSS